MATFKHNFIQSIAYSDCGISLDLYDISYCMQLMYVISQAIDNSITVSTAHLYHLLALNIIVKAIGLEKLIQHQHMLLWFRYLTIATFLLSLLKVGGKRFFPRTIESFPFHSLIYTHVRQPLIHSNQQYSNWSCGLQFLF